MEIFNQGYIFLSDSKPISTNSVVKRIEVSVSKRIIILKIPKIIVRFLAIIGDFLKLPINSERLKKLTESYVVDNSKILQIINKIKKKSIEFSKLKLLYIFFSIRFYKI